MHSPTKQAGVRATIGNYVRLELWFDCRLVDGFARGLFRSCRRITRQFLVCVSTGSFQIIRSSSLILPTYAKLVELLKSSLNYNPFCQFIVIRPTFNAFLHFAPSKFAVMISAFYLRGTTFESRPGSHLFLLTYSAVSTPTAIRTSRSPPHPSFPVHPS
jgi:hypothetical protein